MKKVPRERLIKPIPTGKRERLRIETRERIAKFEANKKRNGKIAERKARAARPVSPRSGAPIPAGRPKGTPNRTTAYLRQAVFLAAELEGSDMKGKDGLVGYIRALARYEKKTYVTLLAKCMPQRIGLDLDPAGLMAKLLQTAAATRSAREGQQNATTIDVTPVRLPKPGSP